MGTIDAVFIESTNSVFLVMVLIVLILILFISSSSFSSKRNVKEPPGPRAFPLLGNLLQLDLKRLDMSLMEVSFFCGNFSGIFFPPCGSFFTFDLPMSVKISTYSTVLSYLRNMDQSSPSIWDLKKVVVLAGYRTVKEALVDCMFACEDKIMEECQYLLIFSRNLKVQLSLFKLGWTSIIWNFT